MSDARAILSVRNITKSFGAVEALKGVSFDVDLGEVVALAGDNGAGKSVLIKSDLRRVHHDSGEILFDGKRVSFASPQEARALGIETIYQDLALADNLSIGANIFLGREPKTKAFGFLPILDRKAMAEAARETMALLDFHTDSAGCARCRLLRRPAPGGRHRPGDLLERQAPDHGRADRRARRSRAAPRAGARSARSRNRARRSSSSRTTCRTYSRSPTASW